MTNRVERKSEMIFKRGKDSQQSLQLVQAKLV